MIVTYHPSTKCCILVPKKRSNWGRSKGWQHQGLTDWGSREFWVGVCCLHTPNSNSQYWEYYGLGKDLSDCEGRTDNPGQTDISGMISVVVIGQADDEGGRRIGISVYISIIFSELNLSCGTVGSAFFHTLALHCIILRCMRCCQLTHLFRRLMRLWLQGDPQGWRSSWRWLVDHGRLWLSIYSGLWLTLRASKSCFIFQQTCYFYLVKWSLQSKI